MTCPLPPTPKFAELSAYKSLAGNRTLYGNTATFKCLPHYAMFGNDTVTCTASGNWTALPECKGKCEDKRKSLQLCSSHFWKLLKIPLFILCLLIE